MSHSLARKSTGAHIHLPGRSGGRDIEIEDIHRQAERGARVWDLPAKKGKTSKR